MEIIVDDSVERFIRTLEKETIAKTLRTVDLLEEFGHRLGMPHSKGIGGGMFELRVRDRQEARLLYGFRKNVAIIVHGFVKKSQKIPKREFATAVRRLQGY